MAYQKMTADERAAKIAAVRDMLDSARATIAETDEWRAYLADATRAGETFHNYSANNWMLIYVQRPNATYVASFARWKQLGRSVRKGEKGLQILTPVKFTKKDADGSVKRDADGNEIAGLAFKVGHVFDYSQTEPRKDVAEPWEPPTTGRMAA